MIRVGLTGSLGAGKSSVGRLFESWGAVRIDADELAREAVGKGSEARERIRELWGERVFDEAGELDRGALRRLVSRDAGARKRLEALIHPAVADLRRDLLERARAAGASVVVEEIPLLFETGLEDEMDVVVVVDAPRAVRRERVCRSRGVSEEEFDALDAAQLAPEEKRARADIVLENAGSLRDLETAARAVWERIVSGLPVEEPAEDPAAGWQVDLHVHTSASPDSLSPPAEVVARARELGLHRVAVTDHNAIAGALEAAEKEPELVIVGEEVRSAEGPELIGLFLTEHIPPGLPFREIAAEIRRQGGVTYLPHPFDPRRGIPLRMLEAFVDEVDVVEGLNGRIHHRAANERAVIWARRHGLGVGAGSDAHTLGEIGRCRTRIRPFSSPRAFREATLRAKLEGSPSSRIVHASSTWAKVWRRLFG